LLALPRLIMRSAHQYRPHDNRGVLRVSAFLLAGNDVGFGPSSGLFVFDPLWKSGLSIGCEGATSVVGPSRHFAAEHQTRRFRSKADIIPDAARPAFMSTLAKPQRAAVALLSTHPARVVTLHCRAAESQWECSGPAGLVAPFFATL
jgi:hypothetical protein